MLSRRDFLKYAATGVSALYALPMGRAFGDLQTQKLNILVVFADQWRAQDFGYAGNPGVDTPRLDAFAAQSVNYTHAVSTCPVCCPYRASLITGRYPLSHGVYLNDLQLNTEAVSFAQACAQEGYATGFIGKWHLDGNGRDCYIPPERRQGFEYWKALECTHDYNSSHYYAGDSSVRLTWPGYDATAQTTDAVRYLNDRAADQSPFALFLAWGPPHAPYRTGPSNLLSKYDALRSGFQLRDNVPAGYDATARSDLAGYYAHAEALDIEFGRLLDTLAATGLDSSTIVVFTSDHGDMLYSHGYQKKQQPWDESIRVPFLVRCPGAAAKSIDAPIGTPDIMPTILGLSGVGIPDTCEGMDLSGEILGTAAPPDDRAALITCPSPFGQWNIYNGREYRGVRTKRYTYVRDLNGPWLLYDNQADPFQQTNLANLPAYAEVQSDLEKRLLRLLCQTGDAFQSRPVLIARCGYRVDSTGTVRYNDSSYWGQESVGCRVYMGLNRFDVAGPDGLPDCVVDQYDLARFADAWLENHNITDFADFAKDWSL